ncbi:MAG TPA: acetolactate synthase [Rhodospirillaceae bacterium]|nr:acetolactate synthase [Rhodospirillaceae bacterium]MAX62346.1 acetolactate synthase [Rhodospirillaceae bacterium]MBB56265.1 acetolactate synthase [Rhodospirillaceae bacterium]HAE03405.1 acetolactate synthase [Rhodospirillaceae bacterium]HAJ23032.1 acetolactate synthase [Rhodospirillaceae bacterium]|tara:strand:+ start:3458 stop:5146 length:1689 start_codon:yes stop_codon:yes gene_type:complete
MWGSDLIAAGLRQVGFTVTSLNPGASYRGLHDSMVNYPDGQLDILTCLHDEHAVAVAHGWTKVTGRPALAMLHSNVGLLHATMAIYNAWVDRAPVVIIGAGGPRDAARRRPWIEWIHTFQDQAQLVRPYTKWDDQPASAISAVRSIAQGTFLAMDGPKGPVYICLDVLDQEEWLDSPPPVSELAARPNVQQPGLTGEQVKEIEQALRGAQRPIIHFGRVSRDESDWALRMALVEALGAWVITDIRSAAAFPTNAPAHVSHPGFGLDMAQQTALRSADCVLLFDPVDPASILSACDPDLSKDKLLLFSRDHAAHRGFVKDGFSLPAQATVFPVDPDCALLNLYEAFAGESKDLWEVPAALSGTGPDSQSLAAPVAYSHIAAALNRLREHFPITLAKLPLSWSADLIPFTHPLDYLGRDGGEGLASGPGLAVGIALALKDSGRLPVMVLGDGDYAMGASALWTAANKNLPLLVLVAANGVYGNDVVHQERVARDRQRSLDNIWVGQSLDHPSLQITDIARGHGALKAVRMDQSDPALSDMITQLAQLALEKQGVTVLEVIMPAR